MSAGGPPWGTRGKNGSGANVGGGGEGPPINRPAARALRLPSGDRLPLTVAPLRASPCWFGLTGLRAGTRRRPVSREGDGQKRRRALLDATGFPAFAPTGEPGRPQRQNSQCDGQQAQTRQRLSGRTCNHGQQCMGEAGACQDTAGFQGSHFFSWPRMLCFLSSIDKARPSS